MSVIKLRHVIREELKRLDEVNLPFDNQEKDLVIGLLNTFGDYGEDMTWDRENIKNADPEWIISAINYYEKDMNQHSLSAADYVRRQLKHIDSRKELLKRSGDGFIITDRKTVKRDTAGPHAITGTSVVRYKIKTRNPKPELIAWLNTDLAKSGYLIDRKITNIYNVKNVYVVDIETTVWYN